MSEHSYSSMFKALLNEAAFTKQMLGSGATQIRQAGYADKGVYFQAFTSLSTGLERIGKLCLMLDYYIEHQSFPDLQYMRNVIGHKISLIHEKTAEIITRRDLKITYLPALTEPIHLSIISVLSEFAIGDRYSNIDLLVGGNKNSDPINKWFESVDKPLLENRITARRKIKICQNAQIMKRLLGTRSTVLHTSEMGEMITTIEEASLRTGIREAVAPYRQFHVLQIIRYWVEVLCCLRNLITSPDIPHFGEMFAPFYNNDSTFRTRKTWDRI